MKLLIIINDAPYGTERPYNAMRLAGSLSKGEGTDLKVFLMADAVFCAKREQNTPQGYYNIERMLKVLTLRHVPVGACGSCMDARGIGAGELLEGVHKSSLDELTDWTLEAEKVIVF